MGVLCSYPSFLVASYNGGKCTLLELYVCYDVTETLYLDLSITNGIVSFVADRKHSSMY